MFDSLMAQDCMVLPAAKTIRLADGFPASRSYVTYSCALVHLQFNLKSEE